jgi:alpha-glucosidase (family GH31 glycosyl hydrolase)
VIEGPTTLFVDAPLDRLPLYVRANALIPTTAVSECLTDEPFDFVIIDAYLLDEGTLELRDVDGTTRISAMLRGSQLDVSVEGAKETLGLRLIPLRGMSRVDGVQVNGAMHSEVVELEWGPDSAAGWLRRPDGEIWVMIQQDEQPDGRP